MSSVVTPWSGAFMEYSRQGEQFIVPWLTRSSGVQTACTRTINNPVLTLIGPVSRLQKWVNKVKSPFLTPKVSRGRRTHFVRAANLPHLALSYDNCSTWMKTTVLDHVAVVVSSGMGLDQEVMGRRHATLFAIVHGAFPRPNVEFVCHHVVYNNHQTWF